MDKAIKKIAAIVTALAVTLVPVCACAAANSADYRQQLLINLGILAKADYAENSAMTRIGFTELVLDMLGADKRYVPDNAEKLFYDVEPEGREYAIIYSAHSLGIIKGGSDGFFRPSEPVTETEACVMLIRALCGEKLLERYQNPMQLALRLKLTDGVVPDAEGKLSCSEAAKMIYNALTAPCIEQKADGAIEIDSESSLLGSVYGIEKTGGIVEADYRGSLYGGAKKKYGIITVGGIDYAVEKAAYNEELLGYRVNVYYTEDGGDRKAVYIDKAPTDSVVIDADKIEKYSAAEITAYENGRSGDYSISRSAVTVKNGNRSVVSAYAIPENGTFTLLDYDGDDVYDAVIIREYSVKLALSASASDETVCFDKDSNALHLKDFDDYRISDADGNEKAISSIARYDVLEIEKADDLSFVSVRVISERKRLTVSAMHENDNGKTVVTDENGAEYELAPCFAEDIRVGTAYEFALDSRGRLAGVALFDTGNSYMVGYAVSADKKNKISSTAEVKIYTSDGKFVIYTLRSKIRRVNDNSDITAETAAEDLPGQLIRYKTDDDGVIAKIEFPSDSTSYSGLRKMATVGASGISARYYSRTMLMGFKFAVNSASVIFMVPPEDSRNDESAYRITNASILQNQQYYPLSTGYNIGDGDAFADYVVIPGLGGQVNKDSDTMVISKIDSARDENGDFRTRLTGFVYGVERKLFLSDESLTVYTAPDGTKATLEAGDCISFGYDFAGDICTYVMRYDMDSGRMYVKGSAEAYGDSNTIHYSGRIAKRRGQYLEFIMSGESESTGYYYPCTNDTYIYSVKKEQGKTVVEKITYNDILTLEDDASLSDTFFAYINAQTMRVLVIYK